ncbi:hypothetical protein GO730_21060 [Spirosoma sp. HMF3257]|uniref:Fibronectin type-III domain-containing protein n=1 Tax=Spirosoma telluris TaxID=2183553 RepID=A0A327NTH2_9BACT|nr:hypothetical protein [Spirosoma telluris]RAI76038.1 hypothetical protein HMF3257_20985 [Spirosoma telluris]
MADQKTTPPKGARLLPINGQGDLFTLFTYLTKQPIDDNWHNYRDFDKVLSNGILVSGTDGKKWLKATGFIGDQPTFTGNVFYEDRDITWYDLPTEVVPAPNPITSLTANPATSSQVDLIWLNPENANVELERSENYDGPYTKIKSFGANDIMWSDKNLKSNTNYYYRIRAVSASGNSPYSDVVAATTPIPTAPAPEPTPTPTYPVLPTATPTVSVATKSNSTQTQSWAKQNQMLLFGGGAALLILIVVLIINRQNQ